MRRVTKCLALLTLLFFWGCSNTILVPVPPRMDLKQYGTIGIIHFTTNSDPALTTFATQQFQEHVQGAFPGTPMLDLGTKETVLKAIGATQLDADAITLIGKKYRVSAVFLGEVVYSDPKTDVTVNDLATLNGSIQTEIRGEVSGKLMETQVGASVWSSSAWAKRQGTGVSVSPKRGLRTVIGDSNPRKEMVPALMFHLTEDFRPRMVRQPKSQP
ncbi:MAG TPA: hypothetical protein PKD12_18060 [Nitrospira sp.]|nr:hypothetical protein [Nitrospira sp.]